MQEGKTLYILEKARRPAQVSHMRYVVESRRHSSCAIIAQGVAGEDEVAQPSVCVNVLRKGCGAGHLKPLPF